MRVIRTLAATGLACLLGACTDSADPMSVISPSADEAPASLAKARRKVYGDIAVDPNSARLKVGQTLRVNVRGKAYGKDVVPRNLRFSSSDSSIATVDGAGKITARKAGRALVRVSAVSNWVNFDPDSVWVTVHGSGVAQPQPSKPTKPTPPADNNGDDADEAPGGDDDAATPPPTTTPPPVTPAPAPVQPAPGIPAPTPLPPTPQPTPPPSGTPATSAGFPNQPSGMFIMTDRNFDSKASVNSDRGNTGSDGWDGVEYRYGGFSIAADPSAPSGDGRVGQMFYSAQHRSGTAPATVQTLALNNGPETLYVSVWLKLSSNWVGNQSGTNKMFFIGAAGGNNQFFMSAEGQGHNTLVPQVRLQGVLDPRPRVAPNLTNATFSRGQWHRWEIVLTCNSGLNASDGTIDLWQDGQHVTSVKNVNWTRSKAPTEACGFSIFNWNPTYGGGGASPGADQYLWFDRVYMSGR